MCERFSWIEKDGEVLFLTGSDVYDTAKGKKLQYCTTPNDFYGHGAIRFYFDLSKSSGTNKECEDFSNPTNFPPELAKAIKAGKMAKFGVNEEMRGLLMPKARKIYDDTCDKARKIYDDTRAPARKIYDDTCAPAQKIYDDTRAPAQKIYDDTCAPAQKIYDDTCDKAQKIYDDTCDKARKIYDDTCAKAFWQLFSRKSNRTKAWR